MSIESKQDLDGMKEAGRIVRAALDVMEAAVRPGVTTAELNDLGAAVLANNGAQSAPMVLYGFPAEICISVNEEIVHGIPSARIVEAGDLVKLDVTAIKDGFIADAAITVVVEPAAESARALAECAKRSFFKAMQVARTGNRVNAIGRVIEREVRAGGYAVAEGLAGHGVGRAIHEPPTVPNDYDILARRRLTRGLVIAVEPMLSAGSGAIYEAEDGWTIKTRDHAPTAHFEHTVVITHGRPLLLTA